MNKKGLFVGNFVDFDTNELPIGCSFAGNYYQLKVKDIIDFKQAVSLVYSKSKSHSKSINNVLYINLRRGRIFVNLFKIIINLLKISNNYRFDFVVFYNLSFYSLFHYLYYTIKRRVKVIIILADAGFILEPSLLSRILTKSLYLANGFLSLRVIPELQKFNIKTEVMLGIILNNYFSSNSPKKKNTVLLSGSLGYTTGFELALQFFSSQNDFKLIITGTPFLMCNDEFYALINKYKSNNIEYLGVLEYEDYQEILSSCEFGLSLRNPSEMEHRMNFPSKILEYMSFGCIAISSISYSELNKDTYLLTEYSIEGMQFFFKNILIDFNDLKRALIIKKALIEIENNYSANVFKSKIYNLID